MHFYHVKKEKRNIEDSPKNNTSQKDTFFASQNYNQKIV